MNHYKDNNLRLVANYHPALLAQLANATDDSIEVIFTKNNAPVPGIQLGDKKLYLHSKFDPFKEAERFISEIKTHEHDLFMVYGFAFAYHLEILLQKINKDATILAIEKNPAVIAAALTVRDLSVLLKDPRLQILIDPGEEEVAAAVKGRSTKTVSFLTHRGSFQIYPEYYSNILKISKSFLSTKDVNIATLAKFEKIWGSNIARNIKTFIEAPGAAVFYGQFKDTPAIVVAAGPSLLGSIAFIRENRDRALIIAVDTAYKILIKHGIEPHFCVAVDPQAINARYFEGVPTSNTILITDPTVHPSVIRFYRGPVVTTGVAFDLMKWLEKLCGAKGEVTHGGSVSTNAYDLACRFGASPVILTGQDLAFTEGYAHARGSYLDDQIHYKTNRLLNVEMFNRSQLTALPKIFVKGITTERVHTNQKMMIFLAWFEKRKDPQLINATVDGAFIPGVVHIKHSDIRLAKPDIALAEKTHMIYSAALSALENLEPTSSLRKKLENMAMELKSLIPLLEKAVGFSENLLLLVNNEQKEKNKLDYILRKLAEIDAFVESKTTVKDIMSLTTQRVIHTITEGYEIDEQDSSLANEVLVAKRSLFLYKGLLDSSHFTKKILGKMLAKIST